MILSTEDSGILVIKDPFIRKYLLGCLKAFIQTTLNKRFYNLSRVKIKGLDGEVDFGFDPPSILTSEEIVLRKVQKPEASAVVTFADTITVCGTADT